MLLATIGAPVEGEALTTDDYPVAALPSEPIDALRAAISKHPSIDAYAKMSEAADASARSERAERLPGFAVGVEWMRMPGAMGDTGLMPNVGIRIPLWQSSYLESARAREAEANAQREEGRAAGLRAHAELEEALARVRDSNRRVELGRNTLLPQAEAAFTSVLGAYSSGRSTLASSLLAQRDLLEVRLALEVAYADHAVAWARLDRVVGRTVERVAAPGGE
jgi:outer membrane protein, heavy metal efflux system